MKPIKHPDSHTGCHGACCLNVQDVSIRIGGDTILEHVNFHMHCGEIIALIGPNGAGKSSLLKTILNQMPYTGTITYERHTGLRTRPRIGYVPQSPTFDKGDPVSVLDLFVSSISRYPIFLPAPRGLRERVQQCLDRVHAGDLLHRRIGDLSGGELQRVLLAMALEPLPQILILDEPMSGIDMEGERQLLEMLDEIRTRFDLSILLTTHDFNTLHLVDKVILLKSKVLTVGTPEEVLASPEFKSVFPSELGRGGDRA